MFVDLLTNVQCQLAEELRKKESPEKMWTTAYKWYINPSLQCPYCQEWLPTERVWVVDEDQKKVHRLFFVGGGRRLDTAACHPHVSSGAICMGDARTPAEALFAGLSSDAYTKPYDWLPKALGHECDELMEAREENYLYCVECENRVRANDAYFSSGSDDPYCSSCFHDNHWSCYECGDSWYVDSDDPRFDVSGDYYCEVCFDRNFFGCEGCGENFGRNDYGGDGRCQDCWDELWECCSECGREFERDDNALDEEGKCIYCRPEEEQDAESESD